MDALYSRQNRTERLIVVGRVVLAAFSLLAIWLDPSTPAKYTETTYTLLALYLGYALLLVPLAWRPNLSLERLGLITHLLDLPTFTLLLYLTEGPASPLFPYFVFFLLAATLRWQWRGTLWTVLATLVVFLSLGVYAKEVLQDPDFELNRFIIRSVYLAVMALLLSYLGVYEQQLRSELARLAAWPRTFHPDLRTLAQAVLENAAKLFMTPRLLLVWEEPEEPWRHVAIWRHGVFRYSREPPAAFELPVTEALAETHFLCLNAQASRPTVLYTSPAGLQHWQGAPLHSELQSRYAIASVLALYLQGEHAQGYLLALDRRDMTADELLLGEIVARQAADDLNRFYAQQRLQQAGAVEARMHLARDLHDGVLQVLTGTLLQLDKARDLLKAHPDAADTLLKDIQGLLIAEQQELRAFVRQLQPASAEPADADLDLAARLNELGERIAKQWNLAVDLTLEPEQPVLPKPLAQAVYRLVQEALINAARHARASTVQVSLGVRDDRVRLSVQDDGRGFPFHGRYELAALVKSQRGPVSLRERILSLGGDLMLDSSASGARLEVTLPLQ